MPIFFRKEEVTKLIKQTISSENSIGLVPTMGSLHKGHLSLIKQAIDSNDIVWVSIFINPTQFNNQKDFKKYPKNLAKDIDLIESISDKINVFVPNEKEMYNGMPKLQIYDFNNLDVELEGKYRKKHFNGVATIVSKLLTLFKPNDVYFGEKDYQQTQIIGQLIRLEKINVNIIICPTVREKNGLALSSRNNLLSNSEREESSIIFKSLTLLKKNFNHLKLESIKKSIIKSIQKNKKFKVEYLEIADSKTLQIHKKINPKKSYRAFICVNINHVRLIDNLLLN
ncbi:uncharacterized protein METZ01_LOCUS17749 [marine metagenome]|uniref:pantoate--beta-alanine ligase (AMP-forming) n=1 Tax=marine metagenome TaxID=408172 RepID=A0A381PD12_9ZZZZ